MMVSGLHWASKRPMAFAGFMTDWTRDGSSPPAEPHDSTIDLAALPAPRDDCG
jgi:hypothetical protein